MVITRPVGFSVEYLDPVASLLKTFVLTYFPDRKLQMVSRHSGVEIIRREIYNTKHRLCTKESFAFLCTRRGLFFF